MPVSQKIGLGLVLTLSVLYGDFSQNTPCLLHADQSTSAFGASIAKCVAIGNLGKGDLTCERLPALSSNTLLTHPQGIWSTCKSGVW